MAPREHPRYPTMAPGTWWHLRKRFRSKMPPRVSRDFLFSALSATLESVSAQTLPDLQRLLLVDERGVPTKFAHLWCDDTLYATACANICFQIYPAELRDAGADRDHAAAWFEAHAGGRTETALRMADLYVVLREADLATLRPARAPSDPS